MLLAQQAFEENNFGRVEGLLRKHDPQFSLRPEEDLRGWEWRYLRGQIRSDESFSLGTHSNTVTCLTFSTDGRWLASASHSEFANDVKVWDVRNRRLVSVLPLELAERVNIMAFAPDSHMLAVADTRKLQFFQAPDWSQAVSGLTLSNRFMALSYSGDGRWLVGIKGNSPYALRVMDAHDHRPVTTWPAVKGRVLALSPDSRHAAIQCAGPAEILVYELATGVEVARLPGTGGSYRQGNICFSPDGRIFASVIARGTSSLGRWVDFWSVPEFPRPAMPDQDLPPSSVIRTSAREYANPVDYRHPYKSMARFADLLALRYDPNRTRHAYYRQIRLIHGHCHCDPVDITETQLRDYFLFVKLKKGWQPKTIRQAPAAEAQQWCV